MPRRSVNFLLNDFKTALFYSPMLIFGVAMMYLYFLIQCFSSARKGRADTYGADLLDGSALFFYIPSYRYHSADGR